ncbi:uncharacterized protein SPPG_07490 [Spizellomyces punctatus DAOM BR117]|uniref:Uncharacterized protein n=1 Tax=Spizellomyces punctatus (strain DAOM BR117) TaxID=645134 RepID=A0A0L0H844_SPIPD|nr:uncharacterized protein SPPG_07490 [Spizellomyces punctatus DAOM BR117]KNC97096.1 hypothetical protein SPPG_07490 [Spizellomyces punctatus DAOM BR117]|eukprot:XP_016605136.1 hypothetical protein SPPG_07490 [Spizellomyces punctatus DAOM BR117]
MRHAAIRIASTFMKRRRRDIVIVILLLQLVAFHSLVTKWRISEVLSRTKRAASAEQPSEATSTLAPYSTLVSEPADSSPILAPSSTGSWDKVLPEKVIPKDIKVAMMPDGCWDPLAFEKVLYVDRIKDMTVNVAWFSANYRQRVAQEPNTPAHWDAFSGTAVWLQDVRHYVYFTRMQYKDPSCRPPCAGGKRSFLFAQSYDSDLRPVPLKRRVGDDLVKFPDVMEIYTPDQAFYTGQEDPRAIADPHGNIILLFHMGDMDGKRKQWTFNTTSRHQSALRPDFAPQNWEKNWTPFFHKNEFRVVYSVQPLHIMACDIAHDGHCSTIGGQKDTTFGKLGGGTPWLQWRDSEYFVGFARTHQGVKCCGTVYRPHVAIMRSFKDQANTDQYEIVYTTGPLDFDYVHTEPPFREKADHHPCGWNRIMTTLGMLRWDYDDDSVLMTASINDEKNFLMRVRGLDRLVSTVVKTIETASSETLVYVKAKSQANCGVEVSERVICAGIETPSQ